MIIEQGINEFSGDKSGRLLFLLFFLSRHTYTRINNAA